MIQKCKYQLRNQVDIISPIVVLKAHELFSQMVQYKIPDGQNSETEGNNSHAADEIKNVGRSVIRI